MANWRNEGIQLLTLGSVRADGTPDIADVQFQTEFPHEAMTISQEVIFDERKVPGRSGKVKQPVGYGDAEIRVTLQLVEETNADGEVRTAEDQYEAIQRIFRDRSDPVGSDTAREVPTVYSISSRLTDKAGIVTVVFGGIEVSESPGTSDIELTITFKEFDPKVLLAEKRKRKKTLTAQEEWDAYIADTTELDYLDAMAMQRLAVEEAHDEEVQLSRLEKSRAAGRAAGKAKAMSYRSP